jgi:hypothetical protein
MAESTNTMLKIERMGGASARSPARRERDRWERRRRRSVQTGEISHGEHGTRGRMFAVFRKPDATRSWVRAESQNRRENHGEKLGPRIWANQNDVETPHTSRGDVARSPRRNPPQPVPGSSLADCHSTCDSSRTVLRRTAQITPADPPRHAAKSACAPPTTVLTNECFRFSKKSFGVSATAEYNLVMGCTGDSQAMRLRETTRVQQSITTATGD